MTNPLYEGKGIVGVEEKRCEGDSEGLGGVRKRRGVRVIVRGLEESGRERVGVKTGLGF